jgi:hypothetical protein
VTQLSYTITSSKHQSILGSNLQSLLSKHLQMKPIQREVSGRLSLPSIRSTLINLILRLCAGEQILIVGQDGDMLGPGGCRALVNAMIGKVDDSSIQRPFAATKDLRILRSGIKDGGAVAISTLLFATARRKSINTALDDAAMEQPEWRIEYLELADNGITSSGASSLGRALSVGMNKTLTSLVLDFNMLMSDGVAALCKGLSTNSSLKLLSLKHCGIDEKGGAPIAKMLKFKRLGLISLDLKGNSLASVGLIDICDGLEVNTSLKTFTLAGNSIGQSEDDMKALSLFADVLSQNTSLIAVDLLHNRIGDKGGSILLDAVKANEILTEFKVDSSDMDSELYNALYRVGAKKDKKKKASKKKK